MEELQKWNKFMQPLQQQLLQPRKRGRSILLAPKRNIPIRSHVIVPVDGRSISPDITTTTNGCFDLTDMETSQMESRSFYATKRTSIGSPELIGLHVSEMDGILCNNNVNRKKNSIDISVPVECMIEGSEKNKIIQNKSKKDTFLEEGGSDGGGNNYKIDINGDALGIYTSLDRSQKDVQVNCDTSRIDCSIDGSSIKMNSLSDGTILKNDYLIDSNNQKMNVDTILKRSTKEILIYCDEDTPIHDNLLDNCQNSVDASKCDTSMGIRLKEIKGNSDDTADSASARVDALLEENKMEMASNSDTQRVGALLKDSKMDIENNFGETARVDDLVEDSQKELEGYFNDTAIVEDLVEDSQKELEGKSNETAIVKDLVEDSRKELEGKSNETAIVEDLVEDSRKELEGKSNETAIVEDLVEDSRKELEGKSNETAIVEDLVEDSRKELEGKSNETAIVEDLVEDSRKELERNSNETARVGGLVKDSHIDLDGNTDDPSYDNCVMDCNQKEINLNADSPSRVPSSMEGSPKDMEVMSCRGSSKPEVMEPVIEESVRGNCNIEENKAENIPSYLINKTFIDESVENDRSHLMEETFIDESVVLDQRTEKETNSAVGAAAAAASQIELNSHFYSSGKVYELCEEQDPFEVDNCVNMNILRRKEKTTSTPKARLRRVVNTFKNISIPSECLGFYHRRHANENVLLLSLRPSGQITIKGMAYVKCLLGSVNIAGYTLKQGEKVPLFAPCPEVSLLVQGPDAVTMTSDPGSETDEGHWIHFFPMQGKQKQQSWSDKNSSNSCTVDENFMTEWMTVTGEKTRGAAQDQWRQLKLVVGERAVVLEVSQFPVSSSLNRVLSVCSGGARLSHSDFMGVALHSPPPPRPRALLALTGLMKKEPFKEPLFLPFSWRQVATCVCADHSQLARCHNQSGVRVMVIGGRGVGRSTFTKFLVNSLLTSTSSNSTAATRIASPQPGQHPSPDRYPALSSTKRPSVCVLDLDPRHSEQSLPGTVSCARYTAPVLGPSYVYGVAHELRRRTSTFPEWRGSHYSAFNKLNFEENPLELPEIIKEFLIGREDLTEVAEEYLAATAVLVDAHRSQCEGDPLVVNCTGADNSIDFRIILEVMRLVNPTHVVHIEGKINQKTEVSPFNCVRANEELGRRGRFHCDVTGKYTSDTDPDRILPVTEKLSYVYARIPSIVKTMDKVPKSYRHDFTIASYFSALWPHFSPTVESDSLQRSVISSCHNFALHVRHGGVHYSQLLNSINSAGLVTLCYIDSKHIKKFGGESYSVVERQPRGCCISLDTSSTTIDEDSECKGSPLKRLKLSAPTLKLPPFNSDRLLRVHGWAVVKGVDPVDKTIHLLIPGCASVLAKINCIVQSNVQLPEEFSWLLYKGCQSRPYQSFVEQGPRNTKIKQRTNKKH